jgi:hypothetical protein
MSMGTVERALQLAPECQTIEEIRTKLNEEGHSSIDAHLQGSLRRDLKRLLKHPAARLQPHPPRHESDASPNPLPDDPEDCGGRGSGDAGRTSQRWKRDADQ